MPPAADDFDTFADAVRSHAPDLDTREAVLAAAVPTLLELGRVVTGAGARHLAEALPGPLATPLGAATARAEGADSGTFFDAVAAREGVDREQAAAHVQAVFRAIIDYAGVDAVRPIRDQLTSELSELLIDEHEDHVTLAETDGPVTRTPPGPDDRPAFPGGLPNT